MVRLNHARNGGSNRFDDMASYITDTSSITNPVGIGFSDSEDDDDDDDDNNNGGNKDEVSLFDSATSALTGLTGWTAANGNGAISTARGSSRSHGGGFGTGEMSQFGESENFPIAHAKSYKSKSKNSAFSESGFESAVSDLASRQVSGMISFDVNGTLDGSVETGIAEIEVMTHGTPRSYKSRKQQANVPPPLQGQAQSTAPTSISPTSSTLSNISNASKKRAPVPPLRDPNMEDKEEDQMWEEDCNYDINPTLMFLVLESHNWREAIALLDGKNLENKNDAWNLGSLFGGKKTNTTQSQVNGKEQLAKKQQKELQVQARTWITRRERHGVLRWRMLPLHAALAFNAPFDVVLRLYHLYPGAVRCRNDQGMLPLHHVFKYGNEDKILELLLDVFPEALTVLDDRKRLPLGCTPKDGSDNERRSKILTLFANFQVEMAMKKEEEAAEALKEDDSIKDGIASITQQKSSPSLPSIKEVPYPRVPLSPVGEGGTLLGASAPRYSTNTDYNHVTYNSIKPPSTKKSSPEAIVTQQQVAQNNMKALPLSPKAVAEEDDGDKYAMLDGEDSENNPLQGNGRRALGGMGLSTIPEDESMSSNPKAKTDALKAELLALGEKKKRKGLRKLFRKKRTAQMKEEMGIV